MLQRSIRARATPLEFGRIGSAHPLMTSSYFLTLMATTVRNGWRLGDERWLATSSSRILFLVGCSAPSDGVQRAIREKPTVTSRVGFGEGNSIALKATENLRDFKRRLLFRAETWSPAFGTVSDWNTLTIVKHRRQPIGRLVSTINVKRQITID